MAVVSSGPLITVIEVGGRGRGFISSKPLTRGEIILRESPILLYSALPVPNSYCSQCFRNLHLVPSTSIVSCPSCSTFAMFCNVNCLESAMESSHTPWICEVLTRLRASTFPTLDHEIKVQVQFLVAAYNLAAISPSNFAILLSLRGNGEFIESAALVHSIISPFFPLGRSDFSVEVTASLLGKDKVNAFGIMEAFSPAEERSVRAYGIYPNVSLFNHDCLPNACRFDYFDLAAGNTEIIIRMVHDVPEGREICLSYFPVNTKYWERQKRLREDYGFICECDRCKVEASWSEDEEDEDTMDEEGDDGVAFEDAHCGNSVEEDDGSFPHAYFFVRYMCDRESCFGTMAPLPPEGAKISRVMECNVCGKLKRMEDL